MDQDSLQKVTRELVHKQIIKSPNKTVKALAACCIADIIRLHAPTCPYSLDELKVSYFVLNILILYQHSVIRSYSNFSLTNLLTLERIHLIFHIIFTF